MVPAGFIPAASVKTAHRDLGELFLVRTLLRELSIAEFSNVVLDKRS
jgi:hypothetical protein